MSALAAESQAILLLAGYYLAFLTIITVLKLIFPLRREVIRKFYHIFFSFSIFILLYAFQNWLVALVIIILFFLIALIYLTIEEYLLPFRIVDLDRRGDYVIREVSLQIIYIIIMQATLLLVFRYYLNQPFHAAIGVLVWGVGDATAAVVGKYYGSLNFNGPVLSPAKTFEGTLSLIIISWLTVIFFGILYHSSLIPAFLLDYLPGGAGLFFYALLLAFTAGLVEAVSRAGLDTITTPVAVAIVSYLSYYFIF